MNLAEVRALASRDRPRVLEKVGTVDLSGESVMEVDVSRMIAV